MKMRKTFSCQFSSNCYFAAGASACMDNFAGTALGAVSVLVVPLDKG